MELDCIPNPCSRDLAKCRPLVEHVGVSPFLFIECWDSALETTFSAKGDFIDNCDRSDNGCSRRYCSSFLSFRRLRDFTVIFVTTHMNSAKTFEKVFTETLD